MAERHIPDELLELLIDIPWPLWREAIASTAISHGRGCTCVVCTYSWGDAGPGDEPGGNGPDGTYVLAPPPEGTPPS